MEARASLLSLNEFCLLELFDFLTLEDSMNLAESCIYLKAVADRTFRKYSTIRLDGQMAMKGKKCISRLVNHFGHHVFSLTIYLSWGPLDWKIVKDCVNLKRLRFSGLNVFQNVPSLLTVDNLEVLTLVDCGFKFANGFLSIVHKAKALNINRCSIEINTLTTVFRNSPDIESFVWWNYNSRFHFKLLELISNVGKLSLYIRFENNSELDPLFKLQLLKKLKLDCADKYISRFLTELAKKGIMQELELWYVEVDENFFEVLKLFEALQLLVLVGHSPYDFVLNSSIVWPPKLKHLRLQHFRVTFDVILSTIKQLKYLESIEFEHCLIAKGDEDNFYDMTKISQSILHEIENSNRQQRLDVVLPWWPTWSFDRSEKEFLIDSERLRILPTRGKAKSEISIDFPDFDNDVC